MTIQDVVSQFNTTPFIFAGSGITRRYYGLPDWPGLLSVFANKISDDVFAYRSYENHAQYSASADDKLPMIATLIEKDFNEAWFADKPGIRSVDPMVAKAVAEGTSPFKAEVCAYIGEKTSIIAGYEEEIKKLKRISKNNIAGVITTNYDTFFESIFDGYKTFVGQDELVFSQLQGVAEIYKIHGSVDRPESIVINHEDYDAFREKGKYLAAKLMTIFMEYPIVFMGYSITDSDIRAILTDMVQCLPEDRISILQKRFVFVEYDERATGTMVSSHSMVFDNKTIEMTKITLSDFGILYEALSKKKAAFPVKVLRRFKDDLYNFILTSEPKATMRVAPLDDERIDEDTLAITIGLASTGYYGLVRAVNSEQWYRNIILHDLQYSADDLLEHVYLELAKQNSWKLPVWYYLGQAKQDYPEVVDRAPKDYSDIVSKDSIDRNRSAIKTRTMKEVWEQEKHNLSKAVRLLGFLPFDKVDVEDLGQILKEIFGSSPNYIAAAKAMDKSNLRKLVRIYDFLKYKK